MIIFSESYLDMNEAKPVLVSFSFLLVAASFCIYQAHTESGTS